MERLEKRTESVAYKVVVAIIAAMAFIGLPTLGIVWQDWTMVGFPLGFLAVIVLFKLLVWGSTPKESNRAKGNDD